MEVDARMGLRPKVKDFNSFLTCGICNGYLIDAMSNANCHHSFCRGCVLRYLDRNKFCPVCLQKDKSDTLLIELRHDRLLQTVVYKMVPNLYRSELQRRMDFLNVLSDGAGSRRDAWRRKPRHGGIRLPRNIYSGAERVSLRLVRRDSWPFEILDSEGFIDEMEGASKNENMMRGLRRYLLCPVEFTIGHLKKYIRFKFDMDKYFEIEIFHSEESLLDDYTLMDVAYIYNCDKMSQMTLYYVIFEPSARNGKPECNNNSVSLSRNGKRKLDLDFGSDGCFSRQQTETSSGAKKPRCGIYSDARRETMQEQEQGGATFAEDAIEPDDATCHDVVECGSCDSNTDYNDLNCLDTGDARIVVAETSDIIAHITQTSTVASSEGFIVAEALPSNVVDRLEMESSETLESFLHRGLCGMMDEKCVENDLEKSPRKDNSSLEDDIVEEQCLRNSTSGQLVPSGNCFREATGHPQPYCTDGTPLRLKDYFQDVENLVEPTSISGKHWLSTAPGESGTIVKEGGRRELESSVEAEHSKDSDAEIDTEIRRIAANVAIADENSMTDYGINEDSGSALPSPYPDGAGNGIGDGEPGVGGHRSIIDSITMSQLFSPSCSVAAANVGISVGNFLVQNGTAFEYLVPDERLSRTTDGLEGVAVTGQDFSNWTEFVDEVPHGIQSGFGIIQNPNFATGQYLPLSNITEQRALGSEGDGRCFSVTTAQRNDSSFPSFAKISSTAISGCLIAQEMHCSCNDNFINNHKSFSSPFCGNGTAGVPENPSEGVAENDPTFREQGVQEIATCVENEPSQKPPDETTVSVASVLVFSGKISMNEDHGSSQFAPSSEVLCANDSDLDSPKSAEEVILRDKVDLTSHSVSNNACRRQTSEAGVNSITPQSPSCPQGEVTADEVANLQNTPATSVSEVCEKLDTIRTLSDCRPREDCNSDMTKASQPDVVCSFLKEPLDSKSNHVTRTEPDADATDSVVPLVVSGCEKQDSSTPVENTEVTLSKNTDLVEAMTTLSQPVSVSANSVTMATTKPDGNETMLISETSENGHKLRNHCEPVKDGSDIQVTKETGKTKCQSKSANMVTSVKNSSTIKAAMTTKVAEGALSENQPGNKVSVGTQTNIDLLGRYFKRRVNPVNSFLAGKSSRSGGANTRDRSTKSTKVTLPFVNSKVTPSASGPGTSQGAILFSGHGTPILFPAVSPVTINGKSTFLITVPGNFSFPSQNGLRPNMTLIQTRLNYPNSRSTAAGISAPVVLHQGTPTSQAMVIGRAVGPPLQLIIPPAASTPLAPESSKDLQASTATNRPGFVCRFTVHSSPPSSQMPMNSGVSTTASVVTTPPDVSQTSLPAVLRPSKPGTCIMAPCSSVSSLALPGATFPTFVISSEAQSSLLHRNLTNNNAAEVEASQAGTSTSVSSRGHDKVIVSSSAFSSTTTSSLQSPSSPASGFHRLSGARHISISNIPHVGNKFSVARKGWDEKVSSGGTLSALSSAPKPPVASDAIASMIQSAPVSTTASVPMSPNSSLSSSSTTTPTTEAPLATAPSDIRVSFHFDAKSGNYCLTQGQKIEGAPVSLIRAILERNLSSPYDSDKSVISSNKTSPSDEGRPSLPSPTKKAENSTGLTNVNDVNRAGEKPSLAVNPHNGSNQEEVRLISESGRSSIILSEKTSHQQDSIEGVQLELTRGKTLKSTQLEFSQRNGETGNSQNLNPNLSKTSHCLAPSSGVVTRSQRASGTAGRVEEVTASTPLVPPPTSPSGSVSRRRSAAEAGIKTTPGGATKKKRRCSSDVSVTLDALSPILTSVLTKQCSIGIARCSISSENSSTHRCSCTTTPGGLVKPLPPSSVFSKPSTITETTASTSVSMATGNFGKPSESHSQATTSLNGGQATTSLTGGSLLEKNGNSSSNCDGSETIGTTSNVAAKPGWAVTRCGMVALPKKVYTYYGSALSHEHIAAREKNIEGQDQGSSKSAVHSVTDQTSGKRNNSPDKVGKNPNAHLTSCYLSPNDEDLQNPSKAPPINQLRRMCSYIQKESHEKLSPKPEADSLPPCLSPFT